LPPLALELGVGKEASRASSLTRPSNGAANSLKPANAIALVSCPALGKDRRQAAANLLDLAAGAPCSSRAHHRGGHVGEARRKMRTGISCAKRKLAVETRNGTRFNENNSRRSRVSIHPLRPFTARSAERAGTAFEAAPLEWPLRSLLLAEITGARKTIARLSFCKYFVATASLVPELLAEIRRELCSPAEVRIEQRETREEMHQSIFWHVPASSASSIA